MDPSQGRLYGEHSHLVTRVSLESFPLVDTASVMCADTGGST